MKTRHVNYTDQSGRVYCHRLTDIVKLNAKHFERECFNCPFFKDTAGSLGVECEFDDACNEAEEYFVDAAESEKHSVYQYVRLGMKSKEEADATLKGYGAEESSEDTLYPEDEEEEK
jgi:hypothetical protein